MSEDIVYEGRLGVVRRVGVLLRVETDREALYLHDDLLSELQLIMAAILGEKA